MLEEGKARSGLVVMNLLLASHSKTPRLVFRLLCHVGEYCGGSFIVPIHKIFLSENTGDRRDIRRKYILTIKLW